LGAATLIGSGSVRDAPCDGRSTAEVRSASRARSIFDNASESFRFTASSWRHCASAADLAVVTLAIFCTSSARSAVSSFSFCVAAASLDF
jgi:hypothetical protein